MDYRLLIAVISGISILLLLILYFRIQAFISLLIASLIVGLVAGLAPDMVIRSMTSGMGNTLGFVATVVGLGAMFGAILEHTGGAKVIAETLVNKLGIKRSPLAMAISGFFIAVPVFFDVAFVILTPVIYALQRRTGKSLLLYAIPLLAGLAITHTFIPPTPGPVAVAEVLSVSLGWVILTGTIAGIPALLVCGLWFGRYIAAKIHVNAPAVEKTDSNTDMYLPSFGMIFFIIITPIFLILLNTFADSGILNIEGAIISVKGFSIQMSALIAMAGHPFIALIIANIMAWYLLGKRQGLTKDQLFEITTRSMAPAGTIILLTGAGGVFKQILIDTQAGNMIAGLLADTGIPLILFAFFVAAIVRIIQGSATVAMLTAAGIVAPLIPEGMSQFEISCIVISIASGASILSHVNDSGFWLVGQYLRLSEKQTAASWTVMTTLLAFTGFATAWILLVFFGNA